MCQINFKKVNEELFDQLERLGAENLSGEALEEELARSKLFNLKTQIQLLSAENALLFQRLRQDPSILLSSQPEIEEWLQSQRKCLESLLCSLEPGSLPPAA